ncbi:MAG TPA: hypothetical protein VGO61_13930 [Steroidobacteraceae bacterium]|jgi:hypothetical protein|nr:hypothetical protein [Steroidobacteraceae bacterium]
MKILVTLMLFATLAASAADHDATDSWGRVRFMLGEWEGVASGEAGKGTVERTYQLVLGDKFIEERDTTRYEAGAGRKPAIHRQRGFISYDKTRKTFMLRHFHEEGFVDLFALNSDRSMPAYLIFESVNFENLGNDWKARESYEVISPDEFIETFELAEPGKDFVVRGTSHFKRKR